MARQIDEVQVETDLGLSSGGLPRTGPSITLYTAQSVTASLSASLDCFKVVDGMVTWLTPTNITTATGINTVSIGQATHTASGTMSVLTGSSLAIMGPPLSSGSLTITTPFSFRVHAGDSRFDGTLYIADGTEQLPSLRFWGEFGSGIGVTPSSGHVASGFYRYQDATIGVTCNGGTSALFTAGGITTNALGATYLFSGGTFGRTDASPLTVYGGATTTTRGLTISSTNQFTATSGTQSGTYFNYLGSFAFAPTSGTAAFRAVELQYEINQTGGANGVTSGLYVNAVNTSVPSLANHDALRVGNEHGSVLRVKGQWDTSAQIWLGDSGTGLTAWTQLSFITQNRSGTMFFFDAAGAGFLVNPGANGAVAFGGNSLGIGEGSFGEFSAANGMRSTFGVFADPATGGGGATTYTVGLQGLKIAIPTAVASATSAAWDYAHFTSPSMTVSGSTAITTSTGFNFFRVSAPTITSAANITNAATVRIGGDPTITGGGAITNPYALWIAGGHVRTDGLGTTGLIKNNNGGAWTIGVGGTDYVVSVSAGSGVSVTGAGGVLTVSATGTTLTAGTGITFVGGTAVTSNIITGKSGGQVAIGGTGASETLTLQSTTHATRGAVTVDASQFLVPAGASSAPMYSFLGDFDTGIYQVGAGEMGFSANGVPLFFVGPTYVWSIRSFLVGSVFSFNIGTTPAILGEAMRVDGANRADSRITLAPGSGDNSTQIADGQFTTSPPGMLNVAPNSLFIAAGTTGNTYAGTMFSQPTVVAQSGTGNPVILNPFATVVIAGPPIRSDGTGAWGTWNPSDSLYIMSGRTVLNDSLLVGTDAGYVFRASNSGSPAIGFFNSNHTQITVSGSRSGGAALTNLLSALNLYGVIVDSTTA
jgi:hypothetical protein